LFTIDVELHQKDCTLITQSHIRDFILIRAEPAMRPTTALDPYAS
jgi:hypothetical protein